MSTAAPAPPQRHAFVLLPQFPLLGLAGAREALAAANEVLEQAAYASLVITPDGQPARASCGTRVAADAALATMGAAAIGAPRLPAEAAAHLRLAPGEAVRSAAFAPAGANA